MIVEESSHLYFVGQKDHNVLWSHLVVYSQYHSFMYLTKEKRIYQKHDKSESGPLEYTAVLEVKWSPNQTLQSVTQTPQLAGLAPHPALHWALGDPSVFSGDRWHICAEHTTHPPMTPGQFLQEFITQQTLSLLLLLWPLLITNYCCTFIWIYLASVFHFKFSLSLPRMMTLRKATAPVLT